MLNNTTKTMSSTAAAAFQFSEDQGIMLVNRRFLGEMDGFDRFDLASTLAHERMHFVVSEWVIRALGHDTFFGASFIVALGDAFTKSNPFNTDEYSKLHNIIDQIGNTAGSEYCRDVRTRGIDCRTPFK